METIALRAREFLGQDFHRSVIKHSANVIGAAYPQQFGRVFEVNAMKKSKLLEVLSFKSGFGAVVRSPDGSIRISLQSVSFDVGEEEYWSLMEMLSESARALADNRAARNTNRIVAMRSQ